MIDLQIKVYLNCHILFPFRHCTSKQGSLLFNLSLLPLPFLTLPDLSYHVSQLSCCTLKAIHPTAHPSPGPPCYRDGRGFASAAQVGYYTFINTEACKYPFREPVLKAASSSRGFAMWLYMCRLSADIFV